MTIYGKVIDSETRAAIPGATVALYAGNLRLAAVAATGTGEFTLTISDTSRPDKLLITSVGYLEKSIDPLSAAGTTVFMLERDVKELPPVVIYPTKGKNWMWWALGIAVLIGMSKKQS
jgi:hypothetical protein